MVLPSDSLGISGQAITFMAFVVGQDSNLVATGTATFQDGSTSLGTSLLDDMSMATFRTSALSSGSHTITVVYGGDSSSVGSTSDVVNLAVYTASTTALTVSSAANPSVEGAAVTFTATLSGSPTGAVTFLDGNSPLAVAPSTAGRPRS